MAGSGLDMEVCGIDPGLGTCGYAVLSVDGESTVVRDAGVFRTDGREPLPARLVQIEADFSSVIRQHQPAAVGVEQLYSHYNHPRTSILMGHARGVILCVAARAGVEVHDFSATEIKRYLTGNGRASKVQMQRAVQVALNLVEMPEPNDVADALAAALCCAHVLRERTMGRAG